MKKVYLIVGLFLILGCSNDIEVVPDTYSKLLTGENSKTWMLEGLQYIKKGKAPESYLLPEDCVFDDYYVFYAGSDKLYHVEEGLSKCDPADPDIFFEGDWALISARATMEFTIPVFIPFKLPYTVKELTDKKLIVEIFFSEVGDESYRFIFSSVRSD